MNAPASPACLMLILMLWVWRCGMVKYCHNLTRYKVIRYSLIHATQTWSVSSTFLDLSECEDIIIHDFTIEAIHEILDAHSFWFPIVNVRRRPLQDIQIDIWSWAYNAGIKNDKTDNPQTSLVLHRNRSCFYYRRSHSYSLTIEISINSSS